MSIWVFLAGFFLGIVAVAGVGVMATEPGSPVSPEGTSPAVGTLPTPTVTQPSTAPPSPPPTPTSTPVDLPFPSPSAVAVLAPAVVVQVVEGDTVDVLVRGEIYRVRLIGVDAPEIFGGVDCFGPEAAAFLGSLLTSGSRLYLERDISETDRYGRLLRYAYLEDGRMVNEMIVARGYARVAAFIPDVKHLARLVAAEGVAQDENRGLWGNCREGGPIATPTPTPPVPLSSPEATMPVPDQKE